MTRSGVVGRYLTKLRHDEAIPSRLLEILETKRRGRQEAPSLRGKEYIPVLVDRMMWSEGTFGLPYYRKVDEIHNAS